MSLRVSVVIPVRNEEKSIGALLDSLQVQTRPPDEIIVVDGGSTDRTVEIVRSYIERGYPIRLICTDHAYPGQARNIGVSFSHGDVIVFWDAGMVPQQDALERLVGPIWTGCADLVHGRLIVQPSHLADRCYMVALLPAWNAEKNGLRFNAHPIANTAIRKKLWEAAGRFPPWRAGEDQVFRERVATLSTRIVYEPNAVALFYPNERFLTLFRKIAVYSRHNLLARRAKSWHTGLGRVYLYTLMAALILTIGLGIPLLLAMSTSIILQLALRAVRNVMQKEDFLPFSPWDIRTLLGTLFLLFLADVATWVGALSWLLADKLRFAPEAFPEPHILRCIPEDKG